MVQMDESIRKQLEKPQTWFCKYFPKRIQNVGEKEIADRQLVYDFKDGRSHEEVASASIFPNVFRMWARRKSPTDSWFMTSRTEGLMKRLHR